MMSVMDMGIDSEMTLRKYKQKYRKTRKIQEAESASPILKSEKTGDTYGEDQQKKVIKEEYHQKAEETSGGDTSAKDSKRGNGVEDFTKEGASRNLTNLDDRSQKKHHGEQLSEDNLVEDMLALETQHGTGNKKKRQGGGGFLKDDDESHKQHSFTEEPISQRKSPDRSETPVQKDKNVKKKKKRMDELNREAVDITVNNTSSIVLPQESNENVKKPCKSKAFKRQYVDEELSEQVSYIEPAIKQHRPNNPKKNRVEGLQDSIVKESLISNAQHTSKKKKTKHKDGRPKSQTQCGFTEELFTKGKHHGGSKTIKKENNTVDQTENTLVEESMFPESQHTSKKKKKKRVRRSLQEDFFAEELIAQRKYQDGSDTLEQMDESVDQAEKPVKKKKKRKNEHQQEDDNIAGDNEQSSDGHQRDGPSCSKPPNKEKRQSRRKKEKRNKNHREHAVKTSLLEESLSPNDQHTSKKKTIHKDGEDKSLKQHGLNQKRIKYRRASKISEQEDESADQSKVCKRRKQKKMKHLDMREEASEHKQLGDIDTQEDSTYVPCSGCTFCCLEVNREKWSKEETNCLIAAVKEYVVNSLLMMKSDEELGSVPQDILYSALPWSQIARKFEKRKTEQCRRKWFSLLSERMNSGIDPLRGIPGRLSSIKMIKWMHDAKLTNFSDVMWEELRNIIGNVPTWSVKCKFYELKRQIPDWRGMRLFEIVDHMYHVMLPKYKAKLPSSEHRPVKPEKKDEFLISEIFQEVN